ncbi:MAG TPA: sugar ABC transporter substrate-binding protein [Streptosporangiaceae bacterium]|nr:sugar ABC transporter substrate-binding protein [Streptosporangiaceae bacterium]
MSSRKRGALCLAACSAIMLALLAACSSSGSGNSTSKSVHLTYALWDPVQEVGYKKSIALFEKSHPNISVTVEQIPYPDYESKLTAEFASGSGPDVFWVNTPFLAQFEQAKVMLNLAPLIKKYHVNMSMYRPALVALHSNNGAIYGLPKDWDTEGIFYNKTYFAAHHITIPANLNWNPTNGGTFLTLAKEATIDKNGHNALSPKFNPGAIATYGVAVVNEPDIGYGPFLASDGVPVFQQKSLAAGVKCSCYPGSVTFDTPAGIASLQFLMNLSLKYHVAPPGSEYGSNAAAPTNQDVTLFTAGKVAMDVEGDWFTDSIASAAKFKFGVLPIPTGPDGRWSFTNGLIDAINVHSPNQQAAWELEQWLGSPTSESIMGSGGYVWPGIASLDTTFLNYWKAKGVDVSPFLEEAEDSSNVETLPVAVQAGQLITSLSTNLGPAWLGSESVAQAVAAATKQGDQLLQNPSQ